VLQACPDLNREPRTDSALAQALRNSSLTTIRHMVMAGVGVTVLPATAVTAVDHLQLVLRPLHPPQLRRVVLAWRRASERPVVIDLLRQALVRSVQGGALARAVLP
jgi:LysR family hydrogen peroxide-inducible transcriptional activator